MLINDKTYISVVDSIKNEIKNAQYKTIASVNRELVLLYYNIGHIINENKAWGNKFIENLAMDIKTEFLDAKGYSVRNLKYMAKFAESYTDYKFVQQVVAQISWGQNIILLDKVHEYDKRIWYVNKTIENGWSRNVLVHQIEGGLYERQAIAGKISNFENTK